MKSAGFDIKKFASVDESQDAYGNMSEEDQEKEIICIFNKA